MSLSIDVTSLPSIPSTIYKNESSSTTSTLSGKSIGRSEQYISPDAEAFNKYMLSKSPEDIGPSDSASNDPLTSFSIRSNADTKKEKSKQNHKSRKHYPRIEAESDSDDYVLDDSDSDDGKCKNCKYKKKYFALRMRMKQVAMQLIEDL
nr:nonstructural protein 5 [synthetic construct]